MKPDINEIKVAEIATDTELAKAINYAEKLLSSAIDVVGAAPVELDQSWARNPKVVGLTILCRSISNFRASMRLVQQEQVLEARALVRLLCENHLWLAALLERGPAFVQDMIEDEAFNRKALGEMMLKLTGKSGADVGSPDALKIRSIIKQLGQQFPNAMKLQAGKTATASVIEATYVEYVSLSLDAVHCSITALGRHLWSERTDGKVELVVSVIPNTH